jgi:hypothetical protein
VARKLPWACIRLRTPFQSFQTFQSFQPFTGFRKKGDLHVLIIVKTSK